jgi:peptide/nickel transport system permease protein
VLGALRETPVLAAGVALVALFAGLTVASFFLGDQAYDQDLAGRLSPPALPSTGDPDHLLGTDALGRDVLARIAVATRISLEIALASVVAGGVLGVLVGMLSGYFGGWLDDVVMRIADAVLAIPIVLFALSVIAVIGGGIGNLIVVIAFTQWMIYARTARGETLVLREKPFVTAARSLGAGHWRILRRHILPHLLPSALVLATLNVSIAILLEAGLSFLGLGVQPPDPSLGSMLAEGRQYITRASWLAIYPGVALMLLVLGINLLGDGLRSRLDRAGGGAR